MKHFLLYIFNITILLSLTLTLHAYMAHNAIVINADSQFTENNGVISGSGTAADPFVISGWEIEVTNDTKDTSAIKINNTTQYFIIKDCYLHSKMRLHIRDIGIDLTNVKNAVIDNVKIEDFAYGIYNTNGIINSIQNCEIFTNVKVPSNNNFGINNYGTINEIIDTIIYNCFYGISNGVSNSLLPPGISNGILKNLLQSIEGKIDSIKNCTIFNCINGIYNNQGTISDITSSDIKNCVADKNTNSALGGCGIENHGVINVVTNCNIDNNTNYGLRNSGKNQIDARNCWWGSSEGPSKWVLKNKGDKIFGDVIYEPWAQEEIMDSGITNAEYYYNLGKNAQNSGNHEEAIKYYTRAIQLNPNGAKSYNNRALSYAFLGKYDETINDFNMAIQNDPDNPVLYNNLGIIYNELGNYEQALEEYNKAIEIDPNFALTYLNRGNTYYNLVNYEQAISDYSKAIQLDKNYAAAYAARGEAYAFLGRTDLAQKDFDRACALDKTLCE
jgi:tetratricopeptide (TPR) repeat protein